VKGRNTLTAREQEVLGLTLAGLTSQQIAARLGVSPRTVAFHRANLWQKLRTGAGGRVHCRRCGAALGAEGAPGA